MVLFLDKKYVGTEKVGAWEEGDVKIFSYMLKSLLDKFDLNGSALRGFWEVEETQNTQILLKGFNNIYGRNVLTNLEKDKYKLEFRGLIVPEEKLNKLRELNTLESKLTRVMKSSFKPGSVLEGESFRIDTMASKNKVLRTDYVISPNFHDLDKIFKELGAPNDLFVKN